MSAEASDSDPEPPFVERNDRPTKMAYDSGRVPIYILVAWVVFIIAYVVVMALLALPDLKSWMQH
jgi:hypothetical protein